MVKCIRFNLFLSLLLISCCALCTNSNQWLIQEINVEDGLPDSTVFSIQQDKFGFMWFGTTDGLARYDGYSFKIFKHDGADPNTLSNNNAGNIFIDSKNTMWIGTFGGGANTLNLNTGAIFRYPYSNNRLDEMVSENVQTFYEDSHSNIWIGTATGLYRVNADQMTHFNTTVSDHKSLINVRVWNITEDLKGDLWIGTSEGLIHLNPKSGEINNYNLPEELSIDISSNQFRKLLFVGNDLWIGSSTGLYSFNLETQKFSSHSPLHNMKINDINFLNNNQLLIASMEGLFQFDLTSQLFRKNETKEYWRALNHVDIRHIFFDKSGLLWLATRDSGVLKVDLHGGLFQHHNNYIPESQQNEQNKQVWSLNHDSDDNFYLGTSETLFKKTINNDFERVTIKQQNNIPGIIRDTKISANNGLWIASSDGLFFLEHDSLEAQYITQPFDLAGIKPTDVFSVEETNNGEIWLALYNIGILRWQPSASKATLIQNYTNGTLTDINIGHIFQDSYNNIWIASNLVGVFNFNAKTEELALYSHDYNTNESLSSNRILDVFQDSQNRIWIATHRGLDLFNQESNTFKHFNTSNGLLDNFINTILEDTNKHLWIVHKFGISHFVPEKSIINNFKLNKDIRIDGLNARAASIDKKNTLYFGSSDGYFTFNPNDINETTTFQPTLAVTEVRINNNPMPFSELTQSDLKFNLYPNDSVISFNFTSLDFKISEQIQYKYRIQGLHEDWLDVSKNRHIELNNLNPGNYHIEIKANNNDGRWIEQLLGINLIVHPLWWNKGWVRILFVLLGIILAVFFHKYRTYKIKNQNEILEQQVKKRTIELIELNRQLKKASITDFLTGLYNRSGFIKKFKAKQKKTNNYCIVLADIDNFKIINDQHSHTAGDNILVKTTEIMRSLLPESDLVARWGGEEFIFYLGNKNINHAFKIIEQIRLKIENTDFNYKGNLIPVTCTFGICHRDAEMGLKDCINLADEAMYKGKKKGKNITVISK